MIQLQHVTVDPWTWGVEAPSAQSNAPIEQWYGILR